MGQGPLPFQYEVETRSGGLTALAGLPTYLDLAFVAGVRQSVERHVGVRERGQGWTDAQLVMALVLLNLAGGDCVDDVETLEGDEGLREVVRRTETQGMPYRERRKLLKRWRREKSRALPSPSALRRYLKAFHNAGEEQKRQPGKAFIPARNEPLRGLARVNVDLLAFVQARAPQVEATLDQDATLIETEKRQALYCYEHYRAYQPLTTWWAEQGVVLHSEFRDGNVPAGYDQLRVLQEALDALPVGVHKALLRSDTAGYQRDLLEYCAKGKHPRFGVIEFAVGADVTAEFKRAVAEVPEGEWYPVGKSDAQWAEPCYVPNWVGHSKKGPVYRFIAIREPLRQQEMPGLEQQSFPFPTLALGRDRYKLFGVVTNRQLPGAELIRWYHARCGKSEEAHGVMKNDLAGGKLPSADFGANAAWWQMVVLAHNLNAAMKSLVLDQAWAPKRMKAIRFALIHLAGRILWRSRQLIIRLSSGSPTANLLLAMRGTIQELVHAPSG